MRICIVAEHASYRFGGEAVLPVHYFSQLRRQGIDAWLLVHARTRPELEALFPADRHRLRFIEDQWFHKLISYLSQFLPTRIATPTLELLNQLLTQYLQQRVLRELIAQESIDLVHQPIPVSPRFPSLMANLGVPVVIGPMNGGMEYPPAFRKADSLFNRIGIRAGRYLSDLANSILPGKKLASILLVANERTRLALPSCIRGQVIQLPENGVDLNIWLPPSEEARTGDRAAGCARFVFIGRLVDWKGVDMAIEALVQVPDAQLEIIGEGPMLGEWQRLAERLGISARVIFTGWLPQKTCALRLHSAVALVLPSIYECGGAVVLEALATATPVIVTRWGGPMDYLDETCGVMVEPRGREAIVQGFVDAMRKLTLDSHLRYRMGINGKRRVQRDFDWERKVDRMIGIYYQAISDAAQFPGSGSLPHMHGIPL